MKPSPKYKKKVLIIYRFLPQYRIDFYNGLRQKLVHDGIILDLIYGKSQNELSMKNDEVDLKWAKYIPHMSLKLGEHEMLWQPYLKIAMNYDLIIVEQANRLLLNYSLMILRKFTSIKLALWGHGLNLQIEERSLRNKFKNFFLAQCDWWFAYTKSVKNFLRDSGFPGENVTVVQNAIDTVNLKKSYNTVSQKELAEIRKKLSLQDGPVGLFCGGMYKEKRLDFLLEACEQIREKINNFEMIFIGDGSESYKIKEFQRNRSWVHQVGSKFGENRIVYFKLSDVLLMPGLVGLVILDTFVTQTPLVTTTYAYHSPEIEYLKPDFNGLQVPNQLREYVDTTVNLLRDKNKLRELKKGCEISASEITLENMITNFSDGINFCLEK